MTGKNAYNMGVLAASDVNAVCPFCDVLENSWYRAWMSGYNK